MLVRVLIATLLAATLARADFPAPGSRTRGRADGIISGVGRSGGTTIIGGLRSGENLTLQANGTNTTTGGINILSEVFVMPNSCTAGTSCPKNWWAGGTQNVAGNASTTVTLDSIGNLHLIAFSPILSAPSSPFLGIWAIVFDTSTTYKMGANAESITSPYSYVSDDVIDLNGKTGIVVGSNGAFRDHGQLNDTAGGGTLDAASNYVGFQSVLDINTGTMTLPTRTGFEVDDGNLAAGNAITTQVGLNVAALANGGSNIAVRTAITNAKSGNRSFKDTGGAPAEFAGPLLLKGSAPTCGTGCSSVTGTDRAFKVTTGAAVSSITVNFSATLTSTPVCTASNSETTTIMDVSAVSTTAVTFSTAVAITSQSIYAHCFQNS
jgi:hypothetical protein